MDKVRFVGELVAVTVPYRSFKEKIRIVKKNERNFKITDLEGILYMEVREWKKDY